MRIIKFVPQVSCNNGEKLLRVLTFANGCYAMHYVDVKGQSKLSLFDTEGLLIKDNVRAESAYIFKSGNYILLYEPTNAMAGMGQNRFRRMYKMYSRDGRVMFTDIESFTPLKDDWIVLFRNQHKELYDDKCHMIDSGQYDFIKFDGGYARISGRGKAEDETLAMLPGDLGRWMAYNNRMKKIVYASERVYNWELCNKDGTLRFAIKNVLTVFGVGFILVQHDDGKIHWCYPSGILSGETKLWSGCTKNISCMVDWESTRMNPLNNGEVFFTYCSNQMQNNSYMMSNEFKDIYEFPNGNFSAVYRGKLCFFLEGKLEPMTMLDLKDKNTFLPDGRFWNETEKVLYDVDAVPYLEGVDGVINLDYWYLAEKDGMHVVFTADGREVMRDVRFLRKINGILVLRLVTGKVLLLHREKCILITEEETVKFVETAF